MDELFDKKWEESIEEMNKFYEFVKELELKKKRGENIDMDMV